jgi:signal peptidase I
MKDSHSTNGLEIDMWIDHFRKKKEAQLPVLSGSMAPLLDVGDDVLVENALPLEIRLGDVIVFKNQGKLETHRVIRIFRAANLSFLQKGDNIRTAEITTGDRLVGKVIAVKKDSRIIQFDSILGKVINFVLTFFSVSTFYLYKNNSIVFRIVRFGLNKMKKIFLYGLRRRVF